jgi:hypothetical protein
MLWGMSPQSEYVQGTMGHWAWDPAGYDEEASRAAIYRQVFGRHGAEAAERFDDALMRVKTAFLVEQDTEHGKRWVRREDGAVRDDAAVAAGLREMKEALGGIERVAQEQTLLPAGRLDDVYLSRMRAEVAALAAFLGEGAEAAGDD